MPLIILGLCFSLIFYKMLLSPNGTAFDPHCMEAVDVCAIRGFSNYYNMWRFVRMPTVPLYTSFIAGEFIRSIKTIDHH